MLFFLLFRDRFLLFRDWERRHALAFLAINALERVRVSACVVIDRGVTTASRSRSGELQSVGQTSASFGWQELKEVAEPLKLRLPIDDSGALLAAVSTWRHARDQGERDIDRLAVSNCAEDFYRLEKLVKFHSSGCPLLARSSSPFLRQVRTSCATKLRVEFEFLGYSNSAANVVLRSW